MNVIQTGNSVSIEAVIRECTPIDSGVFLFEFRFPGGKIRYGTASDITYVDNDSPIDFTVAIEDHYFAEKEQAELSIYHFPGGVDMAVILHYRALAQSQTADGTMTLKTKINGAIAFDLVYRGLVYCTDETVYFPYNPIAEEFETIEKESINYKTR